MYIHPPPPPPPPPPPMVWSVGVGGGGVCGVLGAAAGGWGGPGFYANPTQAINPTLWGRVPISFNFSLYFKPLHPTLNPA